MVEDDRAPGTPSSNHSLLAGHFTALVRAAPADCWDDPSPVAGWRARDVVAHLVEWLPALLEGGSDVRLPAGPSVADDPVGAWQAHSAAVQALLERSGDDRADAEQPAPRPAAGARSGRPVLHQ